MNITLTRQLAPINSAQNARTVREDTAELASYLLSDKQASGSPAFLGRSSRPSIFDINGVDDRSDTAETATQDDHVIPEVPEPPSPESHDGDAGEDGPSAIANLLRRSPPESVAADALASEGAGSEQPKIGPVDSQPSEAPQPRHGSRPDDTEELMTERTPLLRRESSGGESPDEDLEGQKREPRKTLLNQLAEKARRVGQHASNSFTVATTPKSWNVKTVFQTVLVTPASCLPAVCVGLLLNILDALSYGTLCHGLYLLSTTVRPPPLTFIGMILFPLGKPIFSHLGPAGISIFYVSTIVSQLTFSTGSIFRGAVGSELVSLQF